MQKIEFCLTFLIFSKNVKNLGLLIFFTYFSQLHTAELKDGYDWGRLNLQSVTEQNNLDDFLATAELAGTEFTAGIYKLRENKNS